MAAMARRFFRGGGRSLLLGLWCLLLIHPAAAHRAGADQQDTGYPDGIGISEERLGPFTVQDREFTVILRRLRCRGAPEGFGETVESVAIVDMQQNIHYRRSFTVEYDRGRFNESVGVWAFPLDGGPVRGFSYESGKLREASPVAQTAIGLILYFGVIPSAPSSGLSCQILGWRGEKLAALFPPLSVYGKIYELPPGDTPRALRLFEGNTLKFGVWTGWFEVVVPTAVMDNLRPVPLYYDATSGTGAFGVVVDRKPLAEETFVRLYDRPDGQATPRHVIVRQESQIEFLSAYTRAFIERGEAQWAISVQEMPWLHIKIDGRQGFVRDAEDLLAIGIQPAG